MAPTPQTVRTDLLIIGMGAAALKNKEMWA